MTYSTKTRSNTPPGHYYIHQTLSHWKNRQKTHSTQKPKDNSQTMPCPELIPNDHSPAHAIGGVNHMPIPKVGSWLCCQLELSWLPVNRSSKGDTQSSWSIIDFCTQPVGPNHGLCCQCWCGVEIGINCSMVACRNWRRCSMVMLTSTRQMKWKCSLLFLFKCKCS